MHDTWEEARAARKRAQEIDDLEWAAETARRDKEQAERDAEDLRRDREAIRSDRDSVVESLNEECDALSEVIAYLIEFQRRVEQFLQQKELLQEYLQWSASKGG